MCVARFNSVLTSLPPLPFHSLSTPSPLPPSWMCEHHHQAAPMGIAVRPWRVVCVTANMHALRSAQSPSPSCSPSLPLLPCCALTARCFAHREEQEHSPGSRTCGPLTIALLRANLQLSPLLILCSLLLCAISHSMDAMPCHLLQVCVQGAGRRESLQSCSWHFSRHKYASQPIEMPIIFLKPRSSHSLTRLQCPKARVSDSKARAYQPLLACRAREFRNAFLKLRNALITRGFLTVFGTEYRKAPQKGKEKSEGIKRVAGLA